MSVDSKVNVGEGCLLFWGSREIGVIFSWKKYTHSNNLTGSVKCLIIFEKNMAVSKSLVVPINIIDIIQVYFTDHIFVNTCISLSDYSS